MNGRDLEGRRPPQELATAPTALELRDIAKAFPGVQALSGADLLLRYGEIHALVGENGAGKSTLLKIVTGVYQPDEGTVRVDGREVHFASPRDAIQAGIAAVHQERNLIPRFSVAENVTIEQPPLHHGQLRFIDQERMIAEARRWLDVLRLPLDPLLPVERLSVAQMQLVEIAKALSLESRILLLDEPTASITPHEAEILFDVLRRLRDDGVAILFVSHKLEEIFALCDRVTVLRDGRLAALDANLRDLDRDKLVTLMIGRAELISELAPKAIERVRPVLEVCNLSATSGARDVSFALYPGEVLGLYGLVGAGRSELARTLVGDGEIIAGEIRLDGAPVRIRDAREALERYRIGYVSENRQTEGLILAHSVQANVAITIWQRLRNALGWVSGQQERAAVMPFVERLQVKTPSVAQTVGNLSGGNQQKVSLAKWLAARTRILLVDEPTVGIDVKTKQELHELIWELSMQGVSILLISSDMPEMIHLADRILVMKGHRLIGEVANTHRYDEVSEEIMRLIHVGEREVFPHPQPLSHCAGRGEQNAEKGCQEPRLAPSAMPPLPAHWERGEGGEGKRVKLALVGGPMYDALYAARLPMFTAATGIPVEIGAQLIHSDLNDHLARAYADGRGDYDLVSTHTKYAPSQVGWLLALDDLLPAGALDDFERATVELARVEGRLLGVPRNVDTRLLHYRTDLFDDPHERRAFRVRFGYDLAPPATWNQFADVARHFARPPDLFGFAFPGRESGLWGTFFELLAAAGGQMFGPDLRAAFVTPEGMWALGLLRDLFLTWRVTPPELPDWQFDEVSRAFQAGRVAMIADWPATYAAHAASPVGDRFDVALYPSGPAGRRVYSGGFTWAIPSSAADPAASLALLLYLSNAESQAVEAARGALAPRRSVQRTMREAAPAGSRDARRLALLEETVATSMLVPPRFAAYPTVEDALWPALQRGVTGEWSVQVALVEAARRMDEVLERGSA